MSLTRRIGEHRSTVILAVIVVLCLASLASGTRGTVVHRGTRAFVSVTAYPFLKTLTGIENAAAYSTGLFLAYNAAREEASDARVRLADMTQQLARITELRQENQRLRRMMAFARSRPELVLRPVRVNVIEMFRGILMIDKGSMHGVRETMCAVTETGFAGIVTQVDPATSNIVTLHNTECRVGAMIRRNRVRGIVYGSGSDLTRYCMLNYIDMKDDVREGDAVVTSPESAFPAGYPIGTVAAVHEEPGSLWKSAEVEPAVDSFQLDEVFLLEQAAPPIEELTGTQAAVETVAVVAPPVPDTRTVQDRYAP